MSKSVRSVFLGFALCLFLLSGCTPKPWSLVAVGDSIPYNSPNDCPGCIGFVDRYAEAITAATGHAVTVQNLSEHNSLQIDDLLRELESDTVRREHWRTPILL